MPSTYPEMPINLVRLLETRVRDMPSRVGYRFLRDGEFAEQGLSYGALHRSARAIAAVLARYCRAGEPVLLLFPAGLDYIRAFFGCIYGSVIAVPAAFSSVKRSLPHLAAIMADAGAKTVLTHSSVSARAKPLLAGYPAMRDSQWIDVDRLPDRADFPLPAMPNPTSETVALLQYTSGSTGQPKGVMVTHGNLLHNQLLIRSLVKSDERTVGVSWLPHYHDMGLIGFIIQPLFLGIPSILMSPVHFLQKPLRWLEAMTRFKATVTGGPNFAYQLLLQNISDDQLKGLDLSHWRVALNGAEPVRADTMTEFAKTFAASGFSGDAFHPCYGLAEATLLVSGGGWTPAAGEENAAMPDCGPVLWERSVVIADPGNARPCAPGEEGEIWVSGPSVAKGYWNRPGASREVFGARLRGGEGPFLRTGDLGYLRNGRLVVTGRLKDLIIIRGRNYYPQDLEHTAQSSHDALRAGCCAAFPAEIEGEERLVIVAELARRRNAEADEAGAAIVREIISAHEVEPHAVVLVRALSVPKTSSGKIRRQACKEAWLSGSLATVAAKLKAPRTKPAPLETELGANGFQELKGDARLAYLETYLRARLLMAAAEETGSIFLDSLKAAALQQSLETDLGVRAPLSLLFQATTIGQLANGILNRAGMAKTAQRPRQKRPDGDAFPCSEGQKAIWLACQTAPNRNIFRISRAFRISGLEPQPFKSALRIIFERHPCLRTAFIPSPQGPIQKVSETSPLPFEMRELKHGGGDECKRAVAAFLDRPFDLERGLVFRVLLLALPSRTHLVVFSIHHLVADLWSLLVIFRELSVLYRKDGADATLLPPLSGSYADFVDEEAAWLADDRGRLARDYWHEVLAPPYPRLELFTDRPRPATRSNRGQTVSLSLGSDLSARLARCCGDTRTTRFTLLMAAFQFLLSRLSGQQDVAVGSPVAGRNKRDWSSLVGYFANMVPIRSRPEPGESFRTFLARVRERVQGALAHGSFPFSRMMNLHPQPRDPARTPLFDAVLVWQQSHLAELAPLLGLALNREGADFHFAGMAAEVTAVATDSGQYELTLTAGPVGDEIILALEFNTDLFEPSSGLRFLNRYQTVLEHILANPERKLCQYSVISERERQCLLKSWAASPAKALPAVNLLQCFENQVGRRPDAVALDGTSGRIGYASLDRSADAIAVRLRAMGIGANHFVGICLNRSPSFVTAILGVFKAGAAYVPMDPEYPSSRLAHIAADTGMPVIIGRPRTADQFKAGRTTCLDTTLLKPSKEARRYRAVPSPSHPAYAIYTSGSGGQPKGVVVCHGNVIRLLSATQPWFSFGSSDVWTLFHSFAFDFSVWEVWGALGHGGRLLLVSRAMARNPDSFYKYLIEQRVTVLNQTPSAFYSLLHSALNFSEAPGLRLVIFGGEALDTARLGKWFDRFGDTEPRLVNMFGITETTVHVTYRPLRAGETNHAGRSPIGVAIPDLNTGLLDRGLEPSPPGFPGELFVSGSGLAQGYLRRPALTAERFLPNPYGTSPGDRFYRTGDAAVVAANRELIYVGRIDNQVKIRGYRIELGEIESVLAEHPQVGRAVVTTREDGYGQKRLVAYAVAKGEVAQGAWRRFLSERLPSHMIPAVFVSLAEIPLTPNGKVAYELLPAPDGKRDSGAPYSAPRNPGERRMAEIWSKVLGVDRIGIDDNFFELGGDSIKSIRLISAARGLGFELSVQRLFGNPTIRRLLSGSEGTTRSQTPMAKTEPFGLISLEDRLSLPGDPEDAYPLSMVQRALVYQSNANPAYEVYVTTLRLAAMLDLGWLEHAILRIMARHPFLRSSIDLADFSEPLQLVHRRPPASLATVDCARLSAAQQRSGFAAWLALEKKRRFDWARPPLLRFTVHIWSETEFQLTMSEPSLDGWCVATVVTELLSEYASRLSGRPSPLGRPPRISYRDFVALERDAAANSAFQQFWRRALADLPPRRLPRSASPPPDSPGSPGARLTTVIEPGLLAAIRVLAKRMEVPEKTVLLAAHVRVMRLLYGQTDVVTGLELNGRPEVEDGDRLVGVFNNMNVFRLKAPGGSWTELISATFETESGLLEYRRYPFALLQRDQGRGPLFETVFVYTHFHIYQELRRQSALTVLDAYGSDQTFFALTTHFNLDVFEEKLQLLLDYHPGDLPAETVLPIRGYYLAALRAMTEGPEQRYELCDLLESGERERMVARFNDTDRPRIGSLFGCLMQWSQKRPNGHALIQGNRTLSFRWLNLEANRMADRLRRRGLKTEERVGICLPRSPEMVAAFWAVLKCGGAFVPMDPNLPNPRLAYMMRDSGARMLLAPRDHGIPLEAGTATVDPFERQGPDSTHFREACLHPEQLAYVMYTSGSTGTPKGVMVTQAGLANYLAWCVARYGLKPGTTSALHASIAFDMTLTSLFAPTLAGGTVHLMPDQAKFEDIVECLLNTSHDLVKLTPSHLRAMSESLRPAPGECQKAVWVIGGEALFSKDLERIGQAMPNLRFFNEYGPTEAVIGCGFYAVPPGPAAAHGCPIGKPIDNMRMYVLDAALQPAATGVAGQIHIAGIGLARGYCARPGMSARAWVPDRFSRRPGSRLYRTGDLGRFLADGNLDYIGRNDRQVKLRGFRIELGEIENVLRGHPLVHEVAVLIAERGESQRLTAHVQPTAVPEDASAFKADLHAFLSAKLPDYMVPAAIALHRLLPTTPGGKLDRDALAAVEPERGTRPGTVPKTPAERTLAAIWRDVLGVPKVGVNDNFFDLGGDSILSIQIVARAKKAGLEISHQQVFQLQTVAALAAAATVFDTGAIDRGPARGKVPLTPIQRWFFEIETPNPHHWNQSVALLTRKGTNPFLLGSAVALILNHHDAFRLRFTPSAEGSAWRQHYEGTLPTPFVIVDVSAFRGTDSGRETAAAIEHRLQRSLDLTKGPVARSVLLLGGDEDRLLLAVHHLVIDGISLRILLEDIQTAYTSFQKGGPVGPFPRTSSFKTWSLRLQAYALGPKLAAEKAFWLSQRSGNMPRLPRDRGGPVTGNTEGASSLVTASLSRDETQSLLMGVPQAYRTRIDETLLTALLLTMNGWTGGRALWVDLEGHGREALFEDLDLSGTIGWFTTLYPVVLSLDGFEIGRALMSVKEQLRRIPGRGLGYGALRHLNAGSASLLKALPTPEISFNYLGQFQRNMPGHDIFSGPAESLAPAREPHARRTHVLDLKCLVTAGRLLCEWKFCINFHERRTIERLAESFIRNLGNLIAHCRSPRAGKRTASDYPLAGLSQLRIDRLMRDRVFPQDLYPLTPLQEGMLFHTLVAPRSGAYVMQIGCDIEGSLAAAAFQAAWQLMVDRHAALRTTLVWEGVPRPLQWVHAEVPLRFQFLDFSGLDRKLRTIQRDVLRAADRALGFGLTQPPLMRLFIIGYGPGSYYFCWSHHHVLMDGWSTFRLLREAFDAYRALSRKKPAEKVQSPPFRNYISWLRERDHEGDQPFWRDYLRGYAKPVFFGRRPFALPGAPERERAMGSERVVLSPAATEELCRFSRQNRLTLNVLTQAAMGVFLSFLHKNADVVFGAVVSGRPPQLSGSDLMIGSFINTLPVRLKARPDTPLRTISERLQSNQTMLQRFEHSPLANIQKWSPIPKDLALFDGILVFENFPADFSPAQDCLFRIKNVSAEVNENYPLVVVVQPVPRFSIQIKYAPDRFARATIVTWLECFQFLFRALTDTPEIELQGVWRKLDPIATPREDRATVRKTLNLGQLRATRRNAGQAIPAAKP